MSLLQRISAWLRRVSTGWVALSALVVFLLFTALVLPGQSAIAEQVAGDAGSPDTSFTYSADELYRMAEAYGAEGRSAYIRARFTFDLVWPLVYAGFLVTVISWVYGRALQPDSWWQLANLVPLAGALFDYLENVSTSLVMGRYPDQLTVVATLASVFTSLKWIFLGGSFALLLAGLVIAAWRRFKPAPA
jgi:hypothetical protein